MRKLLKGVVAGCMMLAFAETGLSSETASRRSRDVRSAIARFVENQRRAQRIPGLAICVVWRDSEPYVEGFGSAGPAKGRVRPTSSLYLGSVSKTFTALAVAQLADTGLLRFDDPVLQHLPDFRLRGPESWKAITLRHLLTHTSGLSQWSGHDQAAQEEGRFDHIRPVRPPGRRFEYSTLNFIILGRVVERVSGQSYTRFIQEHVFDPLEMRSSFADRGTGKREGLIQGSSYLFGFPLWREEPPHPTHLVPAGYIASSADDLSRYLTIYLTGGRYRDLSLVSENSLREMLTPWGGGKTGPGMAWGVGQRWIGHGGNGVTFSARVALNLEAGHAAGILANVNSGPFADGAGAILRGVMKILEGEEVKGEPPLEIWIKWAILGTLLFSWIRLGLRFRRWRLLGSRPRIHPRVRTVGPLILELLAALLLLLALPRWIGVPLPILIEYFPDLGLALVLGTVSGLASATIQAFLLSASRPGAGRLGPAP